MKKNREARKLKKTDNTKDDHDSTLTPEEKLKEAKAARKAKSKKASIFDENTHHQSKAENTRQRQGDKLRQNEDKAYTASGLFGKLDELDSKIGYNLVDADRSLIRDYMRNAQELWEDFCATRAFFPSERVMLYLFA
jgi:general transcription factor 3C polypeptide 3 (transcription factor C subunit 4)